MLKLVLGFDDRLINLYFSVEASDGSLFPPNLIRSKRNISVYLPEMCRKLSYHFQKDIFIINNTVPAYR